MVGYTAEEARKEEEKNPNIYALSWSTASFYFLQYDIARQYPYFSPAVFLLSCAVFISFNTGYNRQVYYQELTSSMLRRLSEGRGWKMKHAIRLVLKDLTLSWIPYTHSTSVFRSFNYRCEDLIRCQIFGNLFRCTFADVCLIYHWYLLERSGQVLTTIKDRQIWFEICPARSSSRWEHWHNYMVPLEPMYPFIGRRLLPTDDRMNLVRRTLEGP